jgi:dTDP-glucose pyrophosphorylase
MRNKGMCRNVVDRSKESGIKRVVVIAGANHRRYMQEIFNKMPGVKVRNINEVE